MIPFNWSCTMTSSAPTFFLSIISIASKTMASGEMEKTSPLLRLRIARMVPLTSICAKPYTDMENYARLFAYKGSRLSGDITPTYSMLNDEIIEQIVSYFPNLKVIFLARDPVERAWSQLSMGVRLGRISRFDATDPGAVIQRLLQPSVLSLSYPSKIVARWRRYVHPDLFRLYFFDDLERSPAELRRAILHFLGADPNKPSGRLRADHSSNAGKEKLQLTDKVRSGVAQFFKDELRACARELGGPAREWPARYGFSLLWVFIELADDVDLFFWCDWRSEERRVGKECRYRWVL